MYVSAMNCRVEFSLIAFTTVSGMPINFFPVHNFPQECLPSVPSFLPLRMCQIHIFFHSKNFNFLKRMNSRVKPEEQDEKRKSLWDQFCDFTSLVGFRLLHSKHPLWLRLLSTALMVISTLLICFQTRYFWNKYVASKGQRIATVKETESGQLQQPRFLVCLTLQTASLMHGFGSVDFRELVYRYQIERKRQNSIIQQVQREMSQLDVFFGTQFGDANNSQALRSAGIAVYKELRLLREIGAALSFEDADTFDFHPPPNFTEPDYNAERANYRERRNKLLGKCLPGFLRDREMDYSTALGVFVQCRINLAQRLYKQFRAQHDDYFSYAQSVWMSPEELVVRSQFFDDGPGRWEQSWEVDNGRCALGGPMNRTKIDLKAISTEKNFDYILVKANRLEAHPSARISVHLVYEDEESGHLFRANSFELIAGKNLEVTIRGISEIQEDECQNSYPPNCVPTNLGYSSAICKWCVQEVRDACPCANPDLHLAEFIGTNEMRNCTLLDAMQCGPRQAQLYSNTDCPNPCMSIEYTSNYAAYDLTLEMLNMSILEAEHEYVGEQLLLIDKLNEFKRPRAPSTKGADTKVWKASAKLEIFLADYYQVMIRVYRILYGSTFSFPAIFAEDAAALLGDVPLEFMPLEHLTRLDEDKLELCGGGGNNNNNAGDDGDDGDADGGLRGRLVDMGQAFLLDNFRKLSIHQLYPCPISISNENCRRLLNGTGLFQHGTLENLQQMVKPTAYRQCTLELALSLNSTPANPICIVQFYSQTEENMATLNNTIMRLRSIGTELLAHLSAINLPERECQQNKIALLRGLLNTTVLALAAEGNHENAWLGAFRKFQQENNAMRLLTDFLTSRMALITLYYRGLTFQHIVYHDDYTFWELMSDVGGVLGLYFGLTIVTIYELTVFFTLVEREPAEVHRPPPEQLFTRRFLYRRDHSMATDQPVPTIF